MKGKLVVGTKDGLDDQEEGGWALLHERRYFAGSRLLCMVCFESLDACQTAFSYASTMSIFVFV